MGGGNKMSDTKVWCKECYETIRENLNNEYGKGNWYFNNLIRMMKFDEPFTITCYPPALAMEVPVKLKNGKFSKSRTRLIKVSNRYCPFCGKKIKPEDVEE